MIQSTMIGQAAIYKQAASSTPHCTNYVTWPANEISAGRETLENIKDATYATLLEQLALFKGKSATTQK